MRKALPNKCHSSRLGYVRVVVGAFEGNRGKWIMGEKEEGGCAQMGKIEALSQLVPSPSISCRCQSPYFNIFMTELC